jgi:hypothetical protein
VDASSLYEFTAGTYNISAREGDYVLIQVGHLDIHDTDWNRPEFDRVEINSEFGTVRWAEPGELPFDWEGRQAVVFRSNEGFFSEPTFTLTFRYYYHSVRVGVIPAAYVDVTVTITRNITAPVAMEITRAETNFLNAQENQPILLPLSTVINRVEVDSGVDRSNIEINGVQSGNNCTVTIVGNNFRIVPNQDYFGEITFSYRVTDGLNSSNWARVTIFVNMVYRPPVAQNIEATQEMSTQFRAFNVMANVQNHTGLPLTLTVGTPHINGNIIPPDVIAVGTIFVDTGVVRIDDDVGSTIGTSVAQVEVMLRNTIGLSVGDIVVIPFTVTDPQGGSSTAFLRVTLTQGDDPLDMEGYLYVHRRPTAVVAPQIIKNVTDDIITGIVIGNNQEASFDIDNNVRHRIQNNPQRPAYSWMGIRTWEWAVRYSTGPWISQQFDAYGHEGTAESARADGFMPSVLGYGGNAEAARNAGLTWIQNQTNTMLQQQPGVDIILRLRVRDVDGHQELGEWSQERVIHLTSYPVKPVASFVLCSTAHTLNRVLANNTLTVTDMSYDPNGDPITRWDWELRLPSGAVRNWSYTSANTATLQQNVLTAVHQEVYSAGYGTNGNNFRLQLIVNKNSPIPEIRQSEPFAITFVAFRENEPPNILIPPDSQLVSVRASTLYEQDMGQDGTPMSSLDNWGTLTNATHPGRINFNNFFEITSIHPLDSLNISWMFEGQRVLRRVDYNDVVSGSTVRTFADLTATQWPFTHTVTEEGLRPGAYKISVAVEDNPDPLVFGPGAATVTLWTTQSDRVPYHLYIVPRLDMWVTARFGEWEWNINSVGVLPGETEESVIPIRVSDGKTFLEVFEEEGLELEDIVPTIGDTIEYIVRTSRYVTHLEGFMDANEDGMFDADDGDIALVLVNHTQELNGDRTFIFEYTIDDIDDAPEGKDLTNLSMVFTGGTIFGVEDGEYNAEMLDGTQVMRQKTRVLNLSVLPVKLFDFRISSITDPALSRAFNQEVVRYTPRDGMNPFRGVPVPNLAVNNSILGGIGEELIRKGYSFYFEVGSKGMKRDDDEIVITPRFFQHFIDSFGNVTIGAELDGYLPDRHGRFHRYTHSPGSIMVYYPLFYTGDRLPEQNLGWHHEIRLSPNANTALSLRQEISTSEQVWRGRYGIPSEARFFPSGTTAINASTEYRGNILITFQIEAQKRGETRYDYVQRGQWEREREGRENVGWLYNGSEIGVNPFKAVYRAREVSDWALNNLSGAVIVYDGTRSVRDEFQVNPIWRD